MANRWRGEIEAELAGRSYTLCLTLGALAELETKLDARDLMALAERFERGRLSAREAIAVIAAGLRGGGHEVTDQQVASMPIEGGAGGYVRLVAQLLEASFGAHAAGSPMQAGGAGP